MAKTKTLTTIATALALVTSATAYAAAASPFGELAYRAIGPAIAGGRTTAVAGSDRDPLLYFAGGANGGVFKSVDGGASWIPIFDKERTASIGAIAIAPGDDRNVWVGTGESNPRNTVESGAGIWHSTDGGKTWHHVGLHSGLEDAGAISSIAIDPRNPHAVVVGILGQVFRDSTTRGVYVTRDDGLHWQRTLFVGPSSGVSDLTRVPDKPSTLFAGVYQFRRMPWTMNGGGTNGGLYRSDDNGITWRKVGGHGFPAGVVGRVGVAAATRGRVYAIVQSKDGELWRSDDGGTAWKKMPRSEFVGMRPFYFSRIYVDPANRDRAIVVGLVLSATTNGGRSFKQIASNGGWDYHFVWWSKDGRRVAVANDEGLVISANGGDTVWQPYDLPFAQPYHVGLGTTMPAYQVCIGLQDDNSWCGWSQVFNGVGILNRDWEQIGPGDGMWALLDPADPNFIWSTSTAADTGQVYLFDKRTQQVADVSPYARSNAEPPHLLQYRFNWDTPIAFTAETPPRTLVGGNVVFASTDRGQTWTAISPELTRNEKSHQQASGGAVDHDISGAETSDTLLDIQVSKLAPQTFVVGTDDGIVQLTKDGGATWKNVTPPGAPHWGRVYVEAGHHNAATLYAVYDDHMLGDTRPYAYVSDDAGATWRSISGGLPEDLFLRSVREDLKDANILYVGGSHGVYVTFDRGKSWESLRLNMPATAIYDLQIQPQANDLVVASHGRGVWILDDLRTIEELGSVRGTHVKFLAPRDAYRMFQWAPVNTFGGAVPSNEFVGENAPYGATFTYYLDRATKKTPAFEIVDAQGRVVRHIDSKDTHGVAGLNRVSWDLNEDGPAKWTGTFKLNQGPAEGPESLPGAYTVRMRANGQTLEQPLVVKADPRDGATADQYVKRHDFLVQIYAEIGGVNKMLNGIDAHLKRASGSQATALRALQRKLTAGARNLEDLNYPQGLRERLFDVLARMGSSYQAPTAANIAEAADLKTLYDSLSRTYDSATKS